MYEVTKLICDGDLAARFDEARDLRGLVTVEDMKKAAEEAAKEEQ